jgi:D-lyxose ketol-isomerase
LLIVLFLEEDNMVSRQTKNAPMHFRTMVQADVPQGRNGKHKLIVTTILRDLDGLKADAAIKVPLAELAESKEKVRSALNRATRKQGRKVATATDATFLYVWNVAE